jgi:hypothetical protein
MPKVVVGDDGEEIVDLVHGRNLAGCLLDDSS